VSSRASGTGDAVPATASAAAACPVGSPHAAVALAVAGTASPVPLARDDTGGVLVGRARRLVVAPGPRGIAVRAGWGGRAPDGRMRPVPARAPRGAGSAVGRAVQVGCEPAVVVADGVPHPRPVPRRTWYRHTSDWLLVRP
jgi:hypothetical protein